jgi:hypothetical protein
LAPCIARVASHTISNLRFFISAFIDNTETSTFIHLYPNRRFFDRTKAVGVQIRTTGAHLHAETAVELAYILPVSSQIKSSESQYDRPELTDQLKTGRNNGFFEF